VDTGLAAHQTDRHEECSLKRKGTNGQSGASNSGWDDQHGDKFRVIARTDRERHWAWLI
jgi:hypothetical protein